MPLEAILLRLLSSLFPTADAAIVIIITIIITDIFVLSDVLFVVVVGDVHYSELFAAGCGCRCPHKSGTQAEQPIGRQAERPTDRPIGRQAGEQHLSWSPSSRLAGRIHRHAPGSLSNNRTFSPCTWFYRIGEWFS